MSKALKIYLFGFLLIIVLMISIDQAREKPLDWSATYFLNDKKPLDLFVFNQEIETLFADTLIRYQKNPFEYFRGRDSLVRPPETYLFLNNYVFLDDALMSKIMNEVSTGNTLFVVSDGFTPLLLDTLGVKSEYIYYDRGSRLDINSVEQPLLALTLSKEAWSKHDYMLSPLFGLYAFIHADALSSRALGYMKFSDERKYVNFIEVQFGKGRVFLHNQPMVFSNYSLMTDDSLQEYVEKVLSYIPDQPVVWFVDSQQGKWGGETGKTHLSVIFEYPALRMTWLIFFYGLIGFLFFTAKRTQRVVPIIKPLQNTTVDFVKTIGNLYLQEGNLPDIAKKKIIYFLEGVRQHYNIDSHALLAQSDGESFSAIQRLQLKSGKSLALIEEILALIREIQQSNHCDKVMLTRLTSLIDQFWNN